LAILKHIRENFNSSSAAKSKMDYDDVEGRWFLILIILLILDEDVEMTEVKLSRAPDRHEVYKIQMPEGKTHKTRSILEKQEELRKKG